MIARKSPPTAPTRLPGSEAQPVDEPRRVGRLWWAGKPPATSGPRGAGRLLATSWACALLLSALSPGYAKPVSVETSADVPNSPGEANAEGDTKRASADQYTQALEALDAGRKAEAEQLLTELWQRGPTFDVAMALGRLYLEADDFVLAARYYSYANTHLPPSSVRAQGPVIAAGLAKARVQIGELELSTSPAAAQVRVDDVALSPPYFVAPGAHRLSVESKGYAPLEMPVELLPGQTRRLSFELRSGEPAPRPDVETRAPSAQRALLLGTLATLAAGSTVITLNTLGSRQAVERCAQEGCAYPEAKIQARDSIERWSTGLALGTGALALGTSLVFATWAEPAESDAHGLMAYLADGYQPDPPSLPKRVVTWSLQGAALAGLVLSAERFSKLVSAQHNLPEATALCANQQITPSCLDWHVKRGEVQALRAEALGYLAGGLTSHLLGVAVAQLWPNALKPTSPAPNESSGSAGARGPNGSREGLLSGDLTLSDGGPRLALTLVFD